MSNFLKCIILIVLFPAISYAQRSLTTPVFNFESSEHITIGDEVKLRFALAREGETAIKLHLPNGLDLTYGEIVSLGGDYYGLVDTPIAFGQTAEDRKQRFYDSYATLATKPESVKEAYKLLEVIQDEENQIKIGMEKGEKPVDIFRRMETDHYIAWNCITGGMCLSDPGITPEILRRTYFLKQGRFLKLSNRSFDHFGRYAFLAYSTGHELAMEAAVAARRTRDSVQLERAYAMNAFACHYLSDGFAAGHMRTPRWNLYNQVTPPTIGSLLASYMHREDGDLGLFVSNKRGDSWKAYGDGNYYDAKNQPARAILKEAMQISADEIFIAYMTGISVSEDKTYDLIPDLDKLLADKDSHQNHSPLFYWDAQSKKLFRRDQINDVNNYAWTSSWIGWETLLELIKGHGLPKFEEIMLLGDPESRDLLNSTSRGLPEASG